MELDRDIAEVFLLVHHAQSTGQETDCKRPLKIKCTVLGGCMSQTICHIATIPSPFEVLDVAVTVGSSCRDVPWREKRNSMMKGGGEFRPWELLWWRHDRTEINRPKPEQNSVRVLACSMLPGFRDHNALSVKVPRLRPLVLLIRAMLSLRRVCSIGGMLQG